VIFPWHVTAHAVERYQEIVPHAAREFDLARVELVALSAEIWGRYLAKPELAPTITKSGAYQYRGPGPLRLVVVVAKARGTGKPAMVDVVSCDLRRERGRREARQ
jgi:hypothetical protein